MEIVANNIVANQPPKQQLIGTPKILVGSIKLLSTRNISEIENIIL